MTRLSLALSAALVGVLGLPAQAVPLSYTLGGALTGPVGTLGAISFDDAAFLLIVRFDSDDLVATPSGGLVVTRAPNTSATLRLTDAQDDATLTLSDPGITDFVTSGGTLLELQFGVSPAEDLLIATLALAAFDPGAQRDGAADSLLGPGSFITDGGVLTLTGQGFGPGTLQLNPVAVPLPASGVLLAALLGGGLVWGAARRRA